MVSQSEDTVKEENLAPPIYDVKCMTAQLPRLFKNFFNKAHIVSMIKYILTESDISRTGA